MIRLADVALPPDLLTVLEDLQAKIDTLPGYAAQVGAAKISWDKKPKRAFTQIRKTLTMMHGEQCHCAFCETSEADEVEHYRPKNLFPDQTFRWENYLFSCGNCNRKKSDRFAVFPAQDAAWEELQRAPGAPVLAPIPGTPLLLNPRYEDPMDFLQLDINGATLQVNVRNWQATFEWKPAASPGSRDWHRANYTIETIGLNDRNDLLIARRNRYRDLMIVLKFYVGERKAGKSIAELQNIPLAVRDYPNPSVWEAMKRQRRDVQELDTLFAAAPEALTW